MLISTSVPSMLTLDDVRLRDRTVPLHVRLKQTDRLGTSDAQSIMNRTFA